MRIQCGDFSIRTYNSLKNNRIETYEELSRLTEHDLLSFRNFGKKCVQEIMNKRNVKTEKYKIEVRTISGDFVIVETEKPFEDLAMYILSDIIFDLDENIILKGSQIESIKRVVVGAISE